jgi:L-arabinose isomerase
MYNHGIHGVQDMCNLLLRNSKDFFIEAGHWKESDIMDRVIGKIKAVAMARSMSNIRVGTIGGAFKGMGDFFVLPELLKETIGIETIEASVEDITRLLPLQGDVEVEKELRLDRKNFKIDKQTGRAHLESIRIGLAVKKWIEKENLGAFTVNFSAIDKDSGFPTLPFLEASKAMARGIGYAGEGDVITAGLVGTLLSIYPETSFVEMFCPDWKGGRIFLSHMGEVNASLINGEPKIIEKDLPFIDVGNPVMAIGQLKSGKAIFINLAPSRELYTLIVSQVEMVEVKNDKMTDTISGWFVPSMPIRDFLAEFSRAGGTHHSALVYGRVKDVIADFGKIMGWKVIII